MNREELDHLDEIFTSVRAELPTELRERLLAIPNLQPRIAFWDLRLLLSMGAVIPAVLWLLYRYTGDAARWFAGLLMDIDFSRFHLPAMPEPWVWICSSGLIALILVSGAVLYLYREHHAGLELAQRLTRRIT